MKVGNPIQITYQASGATTGLIDVVAQILDETESLDPVNFPDVTLTENGDIPGEYIGSFIPDVVGTWRTVVDSATKPGKVVKQYEVTTKDIDSVATSAEVKAEADQALLDYGVAKSSDIVAPPMLG
jgi:hypothetical protein